MFIESYLYSSRDVSAYITYYVYYIYVFVTYLDFGICDARNGHFQRRLYQNAERECELESFKTHACWQRSHIN